MDEAILRGPCKQLKTPIVWLVFDILPQVASCLPFVGNHYLIYRLFRGLWLTPEGIIEKAEQWPDFEEMVAGARDLSVVIEVDNPFQQPEPCKYCVS